jgi:predicted metal-binding membrane protein
LLAAVALYVNAIIRFAKMPVLLLMVISIALLCVVTWSPYFALVLVLHWLLNKFFSKEPKYEIDANSIRVTSLFAQKTYTWVEVQNVVLKDGLLTIDFLNNHILQYPVIAKEKELNEKAFNQFCTLQLQTLNLKP